MTINRCIPLFFLLFSFIKTNAQLEKTDALYKTILAKDSLLFSVGFNTCDIIQFENQMSNKLAFYHDKDGFSDKGKFLNDIKNGLCKDPQKRQVKRILEEGSTEIFPLYKNGTLYAAIQNGTHLFAENLEKPSGTAKFTHLWTLENNDWKLTTSLSFDHQPYQSKEPPFENDKQIEEFLKQHNIPTLGLGIINNEKLQEIKVFGEIKKGVTAPYNTLFNVASLTKPITAMVALQLISLGKWKLDEPLYHYYTDPDIAQDHRNKKLTTRLILSHQTGFPNWRWMNEPKKLRFEFDPGTKYQYSGEGFEYLRKALENKFKKPLNQLANELIFQPLKMDDTNYIWDKNTDASRFAIGYDKDAKPYETIQNKT
ncbi:serine hydrolase domain-containing protein, partial [Flavobacterium sp. PLA-1-15]|uniref:serine hydrolase domain-containing protein n=1 Tax=Flavobacterium sp. PLA-1-15 TaxID=3380533 RepID=UPI003B826444